MTDMELLALAREGRPEGLDGLLTRYGPLLRYIIRGILQDPGEREDCFSLVSVRIWEKLAGYDPEKGSLKAWLATLARNTALNHARGLEAGGAELTADLADPRPGPEEQVLARERAERIRAVVGRLSPLERSLFYRKYYYYQTAEQMAAELGMTRRAVESRLYRLKGRLRRELGGELDG